MTDPSRTDEEPTTQTTESATSGNDPAASTGGAIAPPQATAIATAQPFSEGQAAPQEATVQDEGKPGAAAKPPRIKIGTQRPGASVPKARPLPLPAAAQRAKPAVAAPSAEKSPGAPRRPSGEESPEDAMAAAEAPAVGGPGVAPSPARLPPREKVEMPNLRQLSPELEQEVADALGDVSLEEIVRSEGGAPATAGMEVEGQKRGRIVAIHNDDVFVELGQRNQGVLSLRQFPEGQPPAVGAELEVVVGGFNAEDGLYQCSLPGGPIVVEDWSQLTEGAVVEATITGHNKGGLECQVHNIRGFIPAGQISLYRVEDFGQFVGQKFNCVVTEANPRRKNLILSRRAILEREKAEAKEKLMASLAPGQVHEGVVRKVMDFGAFVDIGGVDGLVHVSRISWQRVRHPSEVLKEGERVRVQVEKIDPQTHKISLSMRELAPNPWADAERKYPTKSVVHGPVTKITEFGAFVELEPGVEGLVHISELAHHRVFRVSDIVKEGEEIDAEVLSVDPENKRISLSMKALLARPAAERKEEQPAEEEAPEAPRHKPKHARPLKGGLGRSSSRFGLR